MEQKGTALGSLFLLDLDLGKWEAALAERPEMEQIRVARGQLASAIYAASTGMYIHAYASLRIFLELSFAAIHFSANELERRQWLGDRLDFSWRAALDPEDGVLSAKFVREFEAGAVEESSIYAGMASDVYRECSQFAHGKAVALNGVPQEVVYSDDALVIWLGHAKSAAKAVLFLTYVRFGSALLDQDTGVLGDTLEHWFSQSRSVRSKLGLPLEVM